LNKLSETAWPTLRWRPVGCIEPNPDYVETKDQLLKKKKRLVQIKINFRYTISIPVNSSRLRWEIKIIEEEMISRNLKSDCNIQLSKLLNNKSKEIIDEATEALSRTPLKHYKSSSTKQNLERLTNLLSLSSGAIKTKNLIPMVEYAQQIAKERYEDKFDLQEIQMAFNILEEVIWNTITTDMTPEDYPEAFGLAGTVLGAGKEAMAVEYVSLVSNRKDIKSLDLSELFKGV